MFCAQNPHFHPTMATRTRSAVRDRKANMSHIVEIKRPKDRISYRLLWNELLPQTSVPTFSIQLTGFSRSGNVPKTRLENVNY